MTLKITSTTNVWMWGFAYMNHLIEASWGIPTYIYYMILMKCKLMVANFKTTKVLFRTKRYLCFYVHWSYISNFLYRVSYQRHRPMHMNKVYKIETNKTLQAWSSIWTLPELNPVFSSVHAWVCLFCF